MFERRPRIKLVGGNPGHICKVRCRGSDAEIAAMLAGALVHYLVQNILEGREPEEHARKFLEFLPQDLNEKLQKITEKE